MKLKLYIFRHGQTYYNKNKYFTGWKDSKLTPQGHKDAETIAKKLKGEQIDLAFCSHLTRSKETLKTVLKYHPECKKTIVDDRIIERCYGDLQGHSHAAFKKKYGEELFNKYHRSYDFPPPNGESVKIVQVRVEKFLKDLFKLMKKEKINVAISAHGNSMRPIRKYFEHLTIEQMGKLENPWDDYFEYEIESE